MQKSLTFLLRAPAHLLRRGARGSKSAIKILFLPPSLKLDCHPANLKRVVALESLSLLYSPIAKSGNTSTKAFLADCGMQEENETLRPLLDLEWELGRKVQSWSRFTVVRNPYNRALSAYLDKAQRSHYWSIPGLSSADPNGFIEFLKWLSTRRRVRNHHFRTQQELIAWRPNRFDFIIRLETFDKQFREMISTVGGRIPSGANLNLVHPVQGIGPASKFLSESAFTSQDFFTSTAIGHIREIFAGDFTTFGYDDALPPR